MGEGFELDERSTVWVRGLTNSKVGHAILTSERLVFFDEKFDRSAGRGILEDVLIDRLQKRHEEGGPLVDLALADLTGIAHEKKRMAKDRIKLTTADGDYLFNESWNTWSPLLREILTTKLSRRVLEEGSDFWRIEPA
jgi:hypothetical protein